MKILNTILSVVKIIMYVLLMAIEVRNIKYYLTKTEEL